MKFTYIKLSKNQDKMENILKEKNYSKGRRFLDKKDKSKIVNVDSTEKFLNKSYKNVEESYKKEERKGKAKKILSKNQVALYAISLMLITSGYFNYTNNLKTASLGDAKLVNSNIVDESEVANEIRMEKKNNETSTVPMQNQESNIAENNLTEQTSSVIENNSTEQTATKVDSKEYFTQTKLERDKMYSQMIETYEKILENNNISTEQKNTASEEIKNINNKRNGIATSETLIKAKGIEEVVIIVNSDVIDAIVKSNDNLSQEQVAQVSNIISRELGANIENIHITTHK